MMRLNDFIRQSGKSIGKIGSVSHGTLLHKDLIPIFVSTLRDLRCSLPNNIYKQIRNLNRHENLPELSCDLIELLNEYAPPYCYFGAHPGDGSDFGFWFNEDPLKEFKEDDAGLVVSDTSEVPPNYVGYVMHINDHGNVTLYEWFRSGASREVWAMV